jgi:hypothetical protein
VDNEWRLIDYWNDREDLFNLVSDPFDRRDLSATKPQVREQLRQALAEFRESIRPRHGAETTSLKVLMCGIVASPTPTVPISSDSTSTIR